MNKEKRDLIKAIYLYFFSGLGLVLLIIGIYTGVQYSVKKIFLPEYYLEFESGRCAYPAPVREESVEADSEQQAKQQTQCEEQLKIDRKVREVTDVARAITFTVLGTGIFAFHFRLTRKS